MDWHFVPRHWVQAALRQHLRAPSLATRWLAGALWRLYYPTAAQRAASRTYHAQTAQDLRDGLLSQDTVVRRVARTLIDP